MFALAARHPAFVALVGIAAVSGAIAPATLEARTTPFFTAQLAAPAGEENVIAGGVVFTCEGTVCTAPRSRERALRVCSELRREAGSIVSFTAGGEALAASQLERCNG